ncbi:hypothetical protein HOY80DRAFT_941388 [Tuber brumale]|nr:hypothetical protein HOY80DRAFT_941388 [Tuber brumale]
MAPLRTTLNPACMWAKALVGTHIWRFVGGAFTVTGALAGSLLLVQDSCAGRREVIENRSSKFEYLNRRTATIGRRTESIERTVQEVKRDVEKSRIMIRITVQHQCSEPSPASQAP